MAYVGYDYGLGSGSAQNPNPFVYGSGSGYGYDAPFNPQLDHLTGTGVETRTPEWRVTTTSTTSLTAPWPVAAPRALPAMNWPSQSLGVSQQLTPVHHSSLMLPLTGGSAGALQLHPQQQQQLQPTLQLQPAAVQQLHGCNGSAIAAAPQLHIALPQIHSNSIATSLHQTPLTIDVGRPGSSSLPERRMRKAKIEPATSPVRPFACNICGKSFSQAANLTAHRRVHTGEKPFSCPICDRPFSQSSSLVTHKRTHSGERPYACGQCDKSFTDSSTLTKHLRTHSGHKPYSCNMCMMRFTQSGNLHRHMKTHKNG